MRILLLLLCLSSQLYGQQLQLHTSDIHHFWAAYDSVQLVKDPDRQVEIIRRQYLDKGSTGLQHFVQLRQWTPERFLAGITDHPAFWTSVREKTLAVEQQLPHIQQLARDYKKLYPGFKAPSVYFMIGYIETGGTTTQDEVLLGTEILAADSTVQAGGLHPFLQKFFLSNTGIYPLIAHELTHTQQKGGDMETRRKSNLLGFCIAEGSCDFIAELLAGKMLNNPYLVYGRAHEQELWARFKKEMYGTTTADWLYNGGLQKTVVADLGYYMGYAICKSYYQHATNKKQAVKDIITLNLEDLAALDRFLEDSKYGVN